MSALFPHSKHAHDQTLAHTILITHVLHRGFQTGALIGIVTGSFRYARAWNAANSNQMFQAAMPMETSSHQSSLALSQQVKATHGPTVVMARRPFVGLPSYSVALQQAAGRGSMIGCAGIALVLTGWMHGKGENDWKDKSWRILASEGQVEVDTWSLAGATGGLATLNSEATSAAATSASGTVWKTVVGRAALGSMAGVVGYLAWRYGIRKGRRDGWQGSQDLKLA